MNIENLASGSVVPLSPRRRGPDGINPRGRPAEILPGPFTISGAKTKGAGINCP